MLDEAHNIEDVCRDSASIQSQEEGLKYDFIWIYLLQKIKYSDEFSNFETTLIRFRLRTFFGLFLFSFENFSI